MDKKDVVRLKAPEARTLISNVVDSACVNLVAAANRMGFNFQSFSIRGIGDAASEDEFAKLRNANEKLQVQLRGAVKTLAGVATSLWRIQSRLGSVDDADLPKDLRHVKRHTQAAVDALSDGHIQIRDFQGEKYVSGMAVNPLTFQPLPGLGTEVIHETIKPSIFYREQLVQTSDVIIGCPEASVKSEAETGRSTDEIKSTDLTQQVPEKRVTPPEAEGASLQQSDELNRSEVQQ